jgi:hypothetical protein
MDSVLDSMNDINLTGTIEYAVEKLVACDTCPVFRASTEFPDIPDLSDIPDLGVCPNEDWYQRKTIAVKPIANGLHSGDKSSDKDIAHARVYSLLSSNTRDDAEAAIEIIEAHSLTECYHCIQGLFYFPDLFDRFLDTHRILGVLIPDDDLGSMIAQCIELELSESLKLLLNFKGHAPLEIKLLAKKYIISEELYALAKEYNVSDSYYDAVTEARPWIYTHLDVVERMKLERQYTGFRDAYHCLLYGTSEHLQALIVRWDIWGEDCSTDAAREFFNLDSSTPISVMVDLINKKSSRW